jgi:hypothetical protein
MQDSKAPQHPFFNNCMLSVMGRRFVIFLISGGEASHIYEGKHVEKITRLGRKMKEKEAQTSSAPLTSY